MKFKEDQLPELSEKKTNKLLKLIARPFVSFALRHGLKIQVLSETIKISFLNEAIRILEDKDENITVAKLAVMTGIHRRDINRIYVEDRPKTISIDLISKVIGEWTLNKKYQTKSGKYKDLSFEGRESEFTQLVQKVSRELKPGMILFELERSGNVERKGKLLKLVNKAFVNNKNISQNFEMLAGDLEDLILSVEQNNHAEQEDLNLHAKTLFDNIPESDLPNLKKKLLQLGNKYHTEVRELLSKHDRDFNPKHKPSEPAGRISFGTFSNTLYLENKKNEK